MIAPDYPSLYDFESQFETAFAQLVHDQTGVPSFPQRSPEKLDAPWYEFSFLTGSTTEHEGLARDGAAYPDAFTGTLRSRLITARAEDQSLTFHRRHVGKMRTAIYQHWRFLPEGALPYLVISDIRESGTSQSVDTDQRFDLTEISWNVAFAIRSDAWPNPA